MVSYDKEADVLTIYKKDAKVSESIEVAEDIVIDVDKERKIVNLELMDAYKFLHTLNTNISSELLSSLHEIQLKFTNYRNYWIISLVFEYNHQKIEEKLPAFAALDFQSPLISSLST